MKKLLFLFIIQVYIGSLSVALPWNYIYSPYKIMVFGELNEDIYPWNIFSIIAFSFLFIWPIEVANILLLSMWTKLGITKYNNITFRVYLQGLGLILLIYIVLASLYFIFDIVDNSILLRDNYLHQINEILLPFGPLMILGFILGNSIFISLIYLFALIKEHLKANH